MNRTIVQDLSDLHRDLRTRVDDHAPGDWCNGFDTAARVFADRIESLLQKHAEEARARGYLSAAEVDAFLHIDRRQQSFEALGFTIVQHDNMPDDMFVLSNGRNFVVGKVNGNGQG